MDPPRLPLVPRNFPSVFGCELLPFVKGDGDVILDWEFLRGYPLNGYGYFLILLWIPTFIRLDRWRNGLLTWSIFKERETLSLNFTKASVCI